MSHDNKHDKSLEQAEQDAQNARKSKKNNDANGIDKKLNGPNRPSI